MARDGDVRKRDRYDHDPVFVLPPWRAIYHSDDMRRASFDMTLPFHDSLMGIYRLLGYEVVLLPNATIAQRVELVTRRIGNDGPTPT